MKNYFYVFLVFIGSLSNLYPQLDNDDTRQYVLDIEGHIGRGRRSCREHGLQSVKVVLRSGKEFDVYPGGNGYNRPFTTKPFVFDSKDPAVALRFLAYNRESGSKGCRKVRYRNRSFTQFDLDSISNYDRILKKSDTDIKTGQVTVNGRSYPLTRLFEKQWDGDDKNWARIKITPIPKEYTININGQIGAGKRLCREHGLQEIKLILSSGDEVVVFSSRTHSNKSFTAEPYVFTDENELTAIEFLSYNRESGTRGCRRLRERNISRTRFYVDVESCFNRHLKQSDTDVKIGTRYKPLFTGQRGGDDKNWARISIAPVPKIRFDNSSFDIDTFTTIASEKIDIMAQHGYGNLSATYNWDFLDFLNPELVPNPAYIAADEVVNDWIQKLYTCYAAGRGSCSLADFYNQKITEARYERDQLSQKIDAPVWRSIPNKMGKSAISLSLSDLYPNILDREKINGQFIKIRLQPNCSEGDLVSNILFVQFVKDALHSDLTVKDKTPDVFLNPYLADSMAISVSTYPNPSRNGNFIATIELPEEASVITSVLDMTHRVFSAPQKGSGQRRYRFSYKLDELPAGIYFLKTVASNGISKVHKFIIE